MTRLRCPDCGVETPNPNDIAAGYCPRCHWWTSDPVLGPARRESMSPKLAEAHAFKAWRECRTAQPAQTRCACPQACERQLTAGQPASS